MFPLISNSPLSDVLAPPVPTVEEFIFHWNSFSAFFDRNNRSNDDKTKSTIESTNLQNRLIKMAEILVTEQLEWNKKMKDSSCLSPSMEYVLQNNLLDTLSLVAQTDTPIGICPHILIFMTRILTDSKATLIPHKSVHNALNKLIIVCGKIQASPYECTEIYFLNSLIRLICKNPDFINFFTINSFPLINSLISLLYSEDSEISKQAGNSIVKLVKILDESTAKIVTEETPFCCKIINMIINHYNAIPHSIKPEDMETIDRLTFSIDPQSLTLSNSSRKFLCFLKWYCFFDTLMNTLPEHSILTTNLSAEFKTNFLESCILPDLNGDGFENELDAIDNVLMVTILISYCLRNTESSLFDLISHFLIIPDGTETDRYKNNQLKIILLKRCNISQINCDYLDDQKIKFKQLSSVTLQLFEDILSKPSFEVIDDLILKYLSNRNYLNMDQQLNSSGLFENFTTGVSSKFDSVVVLDQMNSVANEIHTLNNIENMKFKFELDHLNTILFLFTSLIPDELKFDFSNERAEYEAYLKEAVKGFHIFIQNCFSKWKLKDKANDCSKEQTELKTLGDFIQMLFDNTKLLFDLPYQIKLQIFSIWAKISLIPNEFIDEFFLDPTICLKESQQSLFNILHKLIEDLQISVKGIDDLHEKLKQIKEKLLEEKQLNGYNDDTCIDERMELILQNLIVLQEFCKEISSIIYAKNYILKLCQEKKP